MGVPPLFAGVDEGSFRIVGDIAMRGFEEGLAPVQVAGKWGYIDSEGKITIEPQFGDVGSFQEELAPVSLGGRWGYRDKSRTITINPHFAHAGVFSVGLAAWSEDGQLGLCAPPC